MQITLVRDWQTFATRRAEWNALVERCATNTIFQTFEWHASWVAAFGKRGELFILIVEDKDRLVGIAPLVRVTRWFWGHTRRVLEFIGANTSGYCDLIVSTNDSQVRALIFDWLAQHRSEWDALDWGDLPDTSPTWRAGAEFFRANKFLAHTRVLYPVAERVLENAPADYALTNTRSLRWQRYRLQRRGHYEFRRLTDFADIAPYLDLFFAMHIRRRQVTAMPSFFHDDSYRVFYRTMTEMLATQGRVVFFAESLDQTLLALGICFEYAQRLSVYQFAFNLEYGTFSPGILLMMDMLRYAIEYGLAEFDLGPGDQPYKYRVANRTQSNMAVRVCRYASDYYVMRAIVGFKLWVSRSPRALAFARRVTEKLKIANLASRLN